MDLRFAPHNLHKAGGQKIFSTQDTHLRKLRDQPLVHTPELLRQLPKHAAGIYTVGGGRQVGKTTLLKLWIEDLLKRDTEAERISFFTGELIDDHHSLVRLIQEELNSFSSTKLKYVVLDEVTYIREWDKGIKFLADTGALENVVLVITGSDLRIMSEARTRFPGRRGKSFPVDFHLYPLSFREVVILKRFRDTSPSSEDTERFLKSSEAIRVLFEEWESYLIHGGFLTAINDMASSTKISPATLATYSDWIRGDVIKSGKQEHYLKEILGAILKRYGTQVSWNALARDLSIDHPKTVADYIELLSSMGTVFIQSAILEHKLTAAPKKAKKLMFNDPFIFHSTRAWLNPVSDPFTQQINPAIQDSYLCGRLAEAAAIIQFKRFYPVYYIKAEGEVDLAYVKQRRIWPVEIKWTSELHKKELKQISKYSNARILCKIQTTRTPPGSPPMEPLPLALFQLSAEK